MGDGARREDGTPRLETFYSKRYSPVVKAPSFRFLSVILTLAAFSLPRLAHAGNTGPSFDCSNAKPASVEELICKSPKLAKDDRVMVNLYQKLFARLPDEQKKVLRQDQRQWLVYRDTSNISVELPADDLHQIYLKRIEELNVKLHEPIHTQPGRVYRNDFYAFEFHYPNDMVVETKLAPEYSSDRFKWSSKAILHIVYRREVESHWPDVWAEVRTDESQFYQTCRNNTPATLNAFSVGDLNGDGGAGRGCQYQDYMNFHNGTCFVITFGQCRPSFWGDDPNGENDKAETEAHYASLMEILQTFRFLDREPKAK